MLAFSKAHRYYLYRPATDMRNGFDGLSGLVLNKFKQDPLIGDVFIFFNQRRNLIKLLHWQGDGFAIFYKRLEKGTYEIPKIISGDSLEVSSQQLLFVLEVIQLSSVRKRPRYEHRFVDKKSMESIL